MANEDTVLEEAMDNLKEAGQRIRATQSLTAHCSYIEPMNPLTVHASVFMKNLRKR
jgi:hypothetical protein